MGTPVYAPAAGVVTLAEPDLYFSGGTVILDHGYRLSSTFLHMSEVSVAVGDELQAGDRIVLRSTAALFEASRVAIAGS